MSDEIVLANSEAWCRAFNLAVYDPDGWDRSGDFEASWTEQIDSHEFMKRAGRSTCLIGKNVRTPEEARAWIISEGKVVQ